MAAPFISVATLNKKRNNRTMKTRLIQILVIFLMVASFPESSSAQDEANKSTESNTPASADLKKTFFNVPIKTFGGKQLWTDLIHLHGYRIQKNVVTNHYRLLDPRDIRLAWGGRPGCERELQRIAREKDLKPMTGRVLIILHGLTRTRSAMNALTSHVQENSDIQVINVSYASTRATIDSHAESLASVIEHLPDVQEINFMGHSMGNIVVRYYLHNYKSQGDSRFKRMVMLAPPNNGSRLAKRLQDNFLYKTFWGVSGQDLSTRWEQVEKSLTTPDFQFGIIAGGQPEQSALDNPLISGKNDLIVTVEETRLPGAHDFMQEHLLHSTMMKNEVVLKAALSFLEHGYFRSAEQRQPISK